MTPANAPPGVGAVLEVDLAAIVANWRLLSARHHAGPVAGVVKADAYGLGVRQVRRRAATQRAAGISSWLFLRRRC